MTCKGMNCTSTDGHGHSAECQAEHAAAVAGGTFVPGKAVLAGRKIPLFSHPNGVWEFYEPLASFPEGTVMYAVTPVTSTRAQGGSQC